MEIARELAELISQTIGEQIYPESTREVSEETIEATAEEIQRAIDGGTLEKDMHGQYWYPGMVDDFGGMIEKDIEPLDNLSL